MSENKQDAPNRLDIDKELNFDQFFDHYVREYLPQYYLFFPNKGYIVWRLGTGENIELLHVRAFKTGQGLGPRIIKEMLREIKKSRVPYYSVWGLLLASNEPMIKTYQKMGFNLHECPGPYKHGPSIMMWQSFEKLCEIHLANDTSDPDLTQGVIKSKNLE